MLKPLKCLKWYGSPNWLSWYLSPQGSAELNKMTYGPWSWGAVKGRVTIVINKKISSIGIQITSTRPICNPIVIIITTSTKFQSFNNVLPFEAECTHSGCMVWRFYMLNRDMLSTKMIKLINMALSAPDINRTNTKIYKTTYRMGPVLRYFHERPLSCNAPGVPPICSRTIQLSTSE